MKVLHSVAGRLRGLSAFPKQQNIVRAVVVLAFLVLAVCLATLLRPLLQDGDSAVYNQQIEARVLSQRLTHVGYVALGIVFDVLLPFGTDMNMNVMTLSMGVLGLSGVYLASHTLTGARWPSAVAVLLALALPSQLRGMLLSEVDVVSASLIAVAYACFLRQFNVLAGLIFGFSVLVTPLSGPLVVAFVFTSSMFEQGLRRSALVQLVRVAKFGCAALLVYVPPIALVYRDYLYGSRGLLVAPHLAHEWPARLSRSAAFIWHEAGLFVPLYVLGAVACLASARVWRIGQPAPALVLSVFVMALAGERFPDVPVQLPNLVLLSILPPVALVASPWAMRLGSVVAVAAGLFVVNRSLAKVQRELRAGEPARTLCAGIGEQSRPRAAVLVGLTGWSPTQMCVRYASVSGGRPATSLSLREFSRHQKRWLATPDEQEIWFLRRTNRSQVAKLLKKYQLAQRAIGAAKLQVLLPRSQ